MQIKTILIGLGKIGLGYDLDLPIHQYVLSHARAFLSHPDFDLLCGIDPDPVIRKIFHERYLKPAYENIKQALIDYPDIDLAVISNPTDQHLSAVKNVLSISSPKAILCEKPLAQSFDHAAEIVELCESKGVQLYVNYFRRADPGAITVKEMIDSELIVQPIKGAVWYTKGFLHNGSHFFDLLEFWLGNALTFNVIGSVGDATDIDMGCDISIQFEKGSVIFLEAWEEYFSHYSIELISPSGRLSYKRGGEEVGFQGVDDNIILPNYRQLSRQVDLIVSDLNKSQLNVANHIIKAFRNESNTLCTGAQALNIFRLIEAK